MLFEKISIRNSGYSFLRRDDIEKYKNLSMIKEDKPGGVLWLG